MADYFVEHRPRVQRTGPPKLVPLSEISQLTGFRSVYAYTKETADLIQEQRSTSFLHGTPVYSNLLFLDFDNCSPDAALKYLRENRIAHEVYNSGNRSTHVHIEIEPMYGEWVPRSQKAWVKQYAPTSDTSYLNPSGQYRLARTWHEKNPGHRKTLLETAPGSKLVIPQVQDNFYTGGRQTGEVRMEDYVRLLITPVDEGGRRPRLWMLGTLAAELGIEYDTAVEHLAGWNAAYANPPHDITTIEKQCRSAYERAGRRQYG